MADAASKQNRIQRVVVVGGGTAGWMAALYINRFIRAMNGKVTVVESPAIGTIGVGEATIPTLVHFIRLLNLDEKEFMRRCSATFKACHQIRRLDQAGHHVLASFRHLPARKQPGFVSFLAQAPS